MISDVSPGANPTTDFSAGHKAGLQPNATSHTAVAPGANLGTNIVKSKVQTMIFNDFGFTYVRTDVAR